MRRRDFLVSLLVPVVASPNSAQSQQKQYRLAVVTPATSETMNEGIELLLNRLMGLGYVEGQNLLVQRYSGEGITYSCSLAQQVVNSVQT